MDLEILHYRNCTKDLLKLAIEDSLQLPQKIAIDLMENPGFCVAVGVGNERGNI